MKQHKTISKRLFISISIAVLIIMVLIPVGCGNSNQSSTAAAFIGSPLSGNAPLEVKFDDHSVGDITDWFWDFDSNGVIDSIERNPTYVYKTPGTYSVSLRVEGSENDTKIKLDYVEVKEPIITANFEADLYSGIAPLEVQFANHSVGYDKWEWDLDNNGTVDSTKENPSCLYKTPGTYTVTLTAIGDYGTDTDSCTIAVYQPLTANFIAQPTSGIAQLPVQFVAQSAADVNHWQWDFDNNGSIDSTEQNPIYTYDAPGTYTVTLTVIGDHDSYEVTQTDLIQVNPQAVDFCAKPTLGIMPLIVQFTDLSTDNVTSWEWDLDGDGNTDSTQQSPVHVYHTPGIYTVSLTATGSNGTKTETKTDFIQVATPAQAGFSATPTLGTGPLAVQFTDQSMGDVAYWSWDFNNDGLVDSMEQNPYHIYAIPGIYNVSLTVSGPGGDSTETKTNYIEVTDPWQMFRHDAQHTGRSSYTGPQEAALKWTYDMGGSSDLPGITSSPAIGADGTIYVGSADDTVRAFNPNGTQKWSFDTNEWIFSSPAIGPDGTIYVGSQQHKSWHESLAPDKQDGHLWALNPNGTLKWSFETTDGWILSSPAIGNDGSIYFGSGDGKLYALTSDGTLKWDAFDTDEWILSSPAMGYDGTIYFGSQQKDSDIYNPGNGHLWALNSDGSLKWSYASNGGVVSSPAIGIDGTIYFGSAQGDFYALLPDGSVKSGYPYSTGEQILSSPAIGADGTIYFGSQETPGWGQNPDPDSQVGSLWALNPDGSLKWKYQTQGWVVSSPAIDAQGTIYFGSSDGNLYAIDSSDGQLKWAYQTQNWIFSCPAIGNGVIYFGSSDDKLYAIGT